MTRFKYYSNYLACLLGTLIAFELCWIGAKYHDLLAAGVEKRFRDLEMAIMDDIICRIRKAGTITDSADWQIQRLIILGNSTQDIEDLIRKAVDGNEEEVRRLYAEVIEREYTFNCSTNSAGIRNVLLTISGLLTLNIASPLGTSIDEKPRVKYTLFLHLYFCVQSIAMRQKMLYHVGMNSKKQREG